MQTINIHEVTSVKLGTVSTFAKSSNRKAFNVRTLEITDAYGNKIAIELFATDREFLTLNPNQEELESIESKYDRKVNDDA